MKKKHWVVLTVCSLAVIYFLTSGKNKPSKAHPVTDFDLTKYLGKWYEIARFDYRFEKHLNNTTAQYNLNEDGTVKVINRGYNFKKKKWQVAEGKAKFLSDPNIAELEVSFFGPFYSGYNVVAIEGNYKYALVAGKNLDYVWILSRETSIPAGTKEKFLSIAQDIGYDTSKFVWVSHAGLSNP